MSSILHPLKPLHPDTHLVEATPTKRSTAKTLTLKALPLPDVASTMQGGDLTVARGNTLRHNGDEVIPLTTDGVDAALIVTTLVSLQK
jgi:hypothetical protein